MPGIVETGLEMGDLEASIKAIFGGVCEVEVSFGRPWAC